MAYNHGREDRKWRTLSSNFWSVNCRGNEAGKAANLLFSEGKYKELDVRKGKAIRPERGRK